ncbi:MAG: thioredoxin [Chloroflexi bacterium]|nr:thioredoxin [Chloroflexota bacterium]
MSSFLKNLFGGSSEEQTIEEASSVDDVNQPIHVSDADFEEVVMNTDKLALVDLWAEWCGPCHMLAPTIEDLAEEYGDDVVIAKLDVDENPKSAGRFNIMGIPTVLFIKQGQEVDRIVGVQGYSAFASRIERLMD